jgi:hypothetical protein
MLPEYREARIKIASAFETAPRLETVTFQAVVSGLLCVINETVLPERKHRCWVT